jgi:uncharacterized protein
MIPREAENLLAELSKGYPLIGITGPRQSGKTTLARHAFPDRPYVSLEDPDTRELAERDPRGFLQGYREGAVIDEAQRCPDLFSYLQGMVDRDPHPGRFVLTGSQQFGLMSGISQSLAGRIALVHLLPFTYGECYGNAQSPSELDEILFTGLYPPVHDRDLAPHLWYANYLQTYIERDVRQLVNIRDLSNFQRFVRLCAGRTGQLLNLSDLASDCGITHNTARSWISILEASYILFLLQPHHRNFNKRIIKTPKLYFYDAGLAAWLLAIQNPTQLNTHSMRGALFETFVIGEMMKARFNSGLPGHLYFWRDRSGIEIDVLIQSGEQLQPVEIKSGQTLNQDYFKGLRKWLAIAGPLAEDPILIYGGDQTLTHFGIRVLPWRDPTWRTFS